MPLITCNECGNQVSGTAKACPQCGAKGKALTGPKTIGNFGKVMVGAVVAVILVAGVNNLMNPPPAQTPEQQAEVALTEKRNLNIVTYARSLRATMRNPESLTFDRVTANEDGTLICFDYRAQNGFGGVNRERTAFTPAGGSREPKVVKMICGDKVMQDVTEMATAIIKTLG